MRIDNRLSQINARIAIEKATETAQKTRETTQIVGKPFSQMLEESRQHNGVTFSKHAQARMIQREIDLEKTDIDKLNSAIGTANEKGVQNTLILMDNLAFIVHVPTNLVITAMKDSDIKEQKLFTNIDGTVII